MQILGRARNSRRVRWGSVRGAFIQGAAYLNYRAEISIGRYVESMRSRDEVTKPSFFEAVPTKERQLTSSRPCI